MLARRCNLPENGIEILFEPEPETTQIFELIIEESLVDLKFALISSIPQGQY